MILVILFLFSGSYILLLSTGLIQKDYMKTVNRHRRLGMVLFGVGLIILGFYNIHYYGLIKD